MELKIFAIFFGLVCSVWARYRIKYRSEERGSNNLIVRGDNNIVTQGYSAQKPDIIGESKKIKK